MSRLIPVWLHATRLLVGVNYVATEVSTITLGGFLGLSVNHVAADLSTIRKVPLGTPCQLCRDFGHLRAHKLEPRSGGVFFCPVRRVETRGVKGRGHALMQVKTQ